MSTINIEATARICHEVNRAFCAHLGDYSQKPWEDAPEWQRESAIAGVRWRLENPDAPDSAQHDSWMAAKIADGWSWGEVKDAGKKTHPDILPYEQLTPGARTKDALFVSIVNAAKAAQAST